MGTVRELFVDYLTSKCYILSNIEMSNDAHLSNTVCLYSTIKITTKRMWLAMEM